MRVLFAALHAGYYRNLDSVVEELASRGHDVHLGSERPESAAGGQQIVERLAAHHSRVTYGMTPGRETASLALASKVRLSIDYLRYLEAPYQSTPALWQRARERAPVGLIRLTRTAGGAGRVVRRGLRRVLDAVDRAQPPSPAIERFLDAQQPDVVLVTPLIGVVPSSQLDLLRSAQARRVPTGVCVWSWDHLSSKAIIRDLPDRLFVWNETQRREALDMHRVPPDRVVVTGAQCFDRWFDRSPSRNRSEFVRHVGLPDEGPYVTWVCSALFPGSPSEAEFVRRWVACLRASPDPAVRQVNIVVRPHPSRTADWNGVDWRAERGLTLWGGNPVDESSRSDYFDTLHHSAAVVGLNTSAFIEAGIVGRPVLAILPPEFTSNQEGTIHFRYLTAADGGLLTTARTLDEHAQQLGAMLAGPPAGVLERQRRFVERFVRPQGWHVPATHVLADGIEALARMEPARARSHAGSLTGSLGLRALQAMDGSRWLGTWLLDEREAVTTARFQEKTRRREAALARKAVQRAGKRTRVRATGLSGARATRVAQAHLRPDRPYAQGRYDRMNPVKQTLVRLVRRLSAVALGDLFEAWRQSWRADVRKLRSDHLETRLRLERIDAHIATLARPAGKAVARQSRGEGIKVPLVLDEPDSTRAAGGDAGSADADVVSQEVLEYARCAVCGGEAWTDVCEFNKLFLLERGPDDDAKLSRYAMCHDCGVVFARRRPVGQRFVYLLERFEATLGRVGAGEKLQGRLWLNSARLGAESKAALKQSLASGVFVSEHQPVERGTHLPALLRDRMACGVHIEVLTSLLTLDRPRILEVRPRFGAIGAALVRRWGGEAFALPLFEGQQLIAQEVYGLTADHLLDFDRFSIPYEGTFDLIVSNHVFTHALRPGDLLATLHDRLTPGGHLYLYNESKDGEFLDHHESMFKVLNPFHFQAFDRDSLLRALRHHGFEPVLVAQDVVLARRVERPSGRAPMSETDRTARLARYRAARDVSVLRLPLRLRAAFAGEWEDIVARAHAEKLAELTPDGRLRVLRERETRADADRHEDTM